MSRKEYCTREEFVVSYIARLRSEEGGPRTELEKKRADEARKRYNEYKKKRKSIEKR